MLSAPLTSRAITVSSETATEFTSGSRTDDRRPVTPEVAGSSPVAPVKFLQIELCCCRSEGGILGNYRLFHAATRSKQTGSLAPDSSRLGPHTDRLRKGARLHEMAGGHGSAGMSPGSEQCGQRRVEANELSNRARSADTVTRTLAPSAARTVRPLCGPSRSMTASRMLA